jgi:hypothetical protein
MGIRKPSAMINTCQQGGQLPSQIGNKTFVDPILGGLDGGLRPLNGPMALCTVQLACTSQREKERFPPRATTRSGNEKGEGGGGQEDRDSDIDG